MKAVVIIAFGCLLLAGMIDSCKYAPVGPECDTCKVPCDTCVECDTCKDTTALSDSTSHAFAWTEYSIPTESSLNGVWVFDSNLAYATGSRLYQYNGSTWSKLQMETESGMVLDISGMKLFAFDPGNCWFVYGTVIFQGIRVDQFRLTTKIHRLDSMQVSVLNACWGTSSSNMFFVGNYGTIAHFDGSKWTKFPKVTAKNLHSIWGTSRANVWAAGFNSTTAESVLLHYDGSLWTEIELSTVGWIGYARHGLNCVWAVDSEGLSTTVAAGSLVWKQRGSEPWTNDSGSVGNELGGGSFVGLDFISGNGPNDFMTGGSWGWLGHWNGRSWHKFTELYNYGSARALGSLSVKENTVCAVGYKDGQSWIALGRRR